jgi:TRAP-type uncharacterized transport system fused permease subunit
MVTPPVCLASYAAASIGKTDPVRTGWEAMRLCAIAYVVPFLFVFSPALLLIGSWYAVAISIATAVVGAVLLGVGLVGYLFCPIGILKRLLFLVAAAGLLIPVVETGTYTKITLAINAGGLLLALIMIAIEWLARSRRQESQIAAAAKASVGG